jgi:hypothetical protein
MTAEDRQKIKALLQKWTDDLNSLPPEEAKAFAIN